MRGRADMNNYGNTNGYMSIGRNVLSKCRQTGTWTFGRKVRVVQHVDALQADRLDDKLSGGDSVDELRDGHSV